MILVLLRNQEAAPPKPLPKFIDLGWGLNSGEAQGEIGQAGESNNANDALCEESFEKLTSQGVLLLVASCDNGVQN